MRKNLIHFLVLTLMTVFYATAAVAQNTITGTVVDADNDEPLIGASVVISGTTQGTVTDLDGNFTITTSSTNVTLQITYIGYKDLDYKVSRFGNVGVIKLQADALLLRDVIVTSSVAVVRKTPVAVSTLDPAFIEENLGTQEFPELLKSTPGVYTIKNGGGYGDSEIMMRGFKSENLAVMINGVPVNDMEWGGVYWSNWAGLSDVTRSMQTQRGLGASKVSGPSVGGSINIVTRSIDAQKGGTVSYTMGENGENKILFSVSTGLNDKGWALTLLGGRNWGDGYIQGTEFDGYTYFVNIAKRINDNHQLSFTGFGNSQIHDQRSAYDGLSIQGWQEVAKWMPDGQQYRYNPTYGFGKNAERKTANKNKYHKPQLSLNHIWEIDATSSLSTALYVSIGDGWGHRGEYNDSSLSSAWYGASNGVLNTEFRNADGTMAYDKMQDINEQSDSGSKLVLSRNKNQHKWYGLLSTYTKQLNDNFNFYAGIDGRYYIGTHTAEITDLMNGDYYMDTRYRVNVSAENNKAAANPDFMYEKLTIGDVVYRDYDGHVLQGGVFGQLEYEFDKLNTFVAGSVSNTTQWRYDRFYYDKEHARS
ncbi:MAG: carboxypeptidase-like regulatory domain-containing protein, partial [Bacteroides sp.]|nr:carboxypeptidase-like regulatory domain-containing protein [Bacteroides sp.]